MYVDISFNLVKEDFSDYPFTATSSYNCKLKSFPNVLKYINDAIKVENCLFFFIRDDNYEHISSMYSEKIHKKTYFDPFFYGIKKNYNYKEENINCAWFIYLENNENISFLSEEFYHQAKRLIEKLNGELFFCYKSINDQIIKDLESLDFSFKVSYCPPLLKSDPLSYHIEAEKTIIKWLKDKKKNYSILDKSLPVRYYIE